MDNRYFKYGCPPLMSDGRFLTNYTRGRIVDQSIRLNNSIDSIQEYKLYLQNNGQKIINNEMMKLQENNTCNVNGECVNISNYNKKYYETFCGKPLDFTNNPYIHIEGMCKK
jgi:hypothetical protein